MRSHWNVSSSRTSGHAVHGKVDELDIGRQQEQLQPKTQYTAVEHYGVYRKQGQRYRAASLQEHRPVTISDESQGTRELKKAPRKDQPLAWWSVRPLRCWKVLSWTPDQVLPRPCKLVLEPPYWTHGVQKSYETIQNSKTN